MPIGPGKYDDLCSMVRDHAGIAAEFKPGEGYGVIVIVFGGDRGDGFSCQADLETTLHLPDILENVAREIRESISREGLEGKADA